jgi:hypothetical protein
VSEIYFDIALELYLLIGTSYMFFASSEKQLSAMQRARPGWSEARCRQFFFAFRVLFAALPLRFAYRVFHVWQGGSQ